MFRNFCILNTHTLGFILRPFAARIAQRWQDVDPLASASPAAAGGAVRPE
jgi:hypothetical protein